MFAISQGKGFHIKFPNGWAISVQFGPGNYCTNRYAGFSGKDNPRNSDFYHSDDAEIAVFDATDNFVKLTPWDTVEGYVSPARVAEVIAIISGPTPDTIRHIPETEEVQ